MNHFDNLFFSIGFILILISGLIPLVLGDDKTSDIAAAIIAVIGLISMLYGFFQHGKKENSKKQAP